ncbi:ATP-binding region [Variibacter gotjawalensis]|uniref:ATP-binding region n=1 Tax=Variibacter gotjawalensis TaxID=1333996 RepID=A0A0S3Q136_9BRAD|nr:ATP-binding protein [Variibacter gotjawalensis]NIK47520.1 uncharacterized protein (TIGR00290 family) [Variibacter gotjawalensis]RZS49417.1 uncharacterized protein (TIGR00290 family) [Variibacter gotjawalensis]BAT61680.1 ATP-binding region [Variibacter gotjawalensis]
MKAIIAWSTGKDSAWALHRVRSQYEIVGALTTITDAFRRVSMHGVREEIWQAQLASAGLAPIPVRIPYPCPNEAYEAAMEAALAPQIAAGVTHVIFGDLFLRDIRAYREERLRPLGLTPVFPLWDEPTDQLAREMMAGGLTARLTCVDLKKLPRDFAGRAFDAALIRDLPEGIDPCGENGEFHTCVTGGPMFAKALAVESGIVTERDGFCFADLSLRAGNGGTK